MVEKFKTNNKLRKIRCIVKSVNITPVYGITIPSAIALLYSNTYFIVKEDNGNIILQSGALPIPVKKLELRQSTIKIGTIII